MMEGCTTQTSGSFSVAQHHHLEKEKREGHLGERQEATRMPSTLGGFFWMRSAMVHLPSGV